MMLKHLLSLVFFLTVGNLLSQDKVTYQFDNIYESIYNYENETFEEKAKLKDLGLIEIHFDKKAVVIDCKNDEGDKELKIIEKSGESSDEEMYICAMNGQYYAFSLSPDRTELTLVSADYRYIYKIKN